MQNLYPSSFIFPSHHMIVKSVHSVEFSSYWLNKNLLTHNFELKFLWYVYCVHARGETLIVLYDSFVNHGKPDSRERAPDPVDTVLYKRIRIGPDPEKYLCHVLCSCDRGNFRSSKWLICESFFFSWSHLRQLSKI